MRRSACGAGAHPQGFQLREDERIDRISCPVSSCCRRHFRPFHRLKRPPVAAGADRGRALVAVDRSPFGPSGPGGDPRFSRRRISASASFCDRPCRAGGISPATTRSRSKLSSGFPATITSPLLPPRRNESSRVSTRSPDAAVSLWHSRHRIARIGATLLSKSTSSPRNRRSATQKPRHDQRQSTSTPVHCTAMPLPRTHRGSFAARCIPQSRRQSTPASYLRDASLSLAFRL